MNEPLYVGRPNLGDRETFLARVHDMLDRRWLSNDGPYVRDFEQRICELTGARHAMAVTNATMALQLAASALDLKGEVVMPSYTFIATAHALRWLGIRPVFADIDPASHMMDPVHVESLITPQTTGIVGVHLWGRPCDVEALDDIAARHGLRLMFDASHAFGCSAAGRMIGGFGACEVFSFHATKVVNSFEGGAVVTNDDALADRVRLMRNFGFQGADNVVGLGVNAKMNEVCAAMGLTNLEALEQIVSVNRRNHQLYYELLAGVQGIRLLGFDERERNTFQFVVIEVDPMVFPVDRDALLAALQAAKVMARRYFWPGCHRMEPYATDEPEAWKRLPQTERLASRVLALPTGQAVDDEAVRRVCGIIRKAGKR